MASNPHNRKLTPPQGLVYLRSKLHVVADRQTGLYLQAVHSCSAENGNLCHEILDNPATAARLPWLVVTGKLGIMPSRCGRVAFQQAPTPATSAGEKRPMVPKSHRSLHPGPTRNVWTNTLTDSQPPAIVAARYRRSDRAPSNPPGPAPVPGKSVS